MEDITPRILSEGKYSAILFPGDLGAYAEGWVEISAGGKTSVYKAPATIGESSVLESGKETVLNLRLKSDGDIGTDPDPDTDYSGRTCCRLQRQDVLGLRGQDSQPARLSKR